MTEEEIRALLGVPGRGEVEIKKVHFPALKPLSDASGLKTGLRHLNDVHMEISVEIGRGELKLGELLALDEGSVIKLDKAVGEAVEIGVNQQNFAKGEVVVVNDAFSVRVNAVNQARNIKLSEGLI